MKFGLRKEVYAYAIILKTVGDWSSDELQKGQLDLPDMKHNLDEKLNSASYHPGKK